MILSDEVLIETLTRRGYVVTQTQARVVTLAGAQAMLKDVVEEKRKGGVMEVHDPRRLAADREQSARFAALKLDAKRIALARQVFHELFSNNRKLDGGCDDLDYPSDWADEDKHMFSADFHTWNGDPHEALSGYPIGFSPAVSYLTAALLKHASETV